MKHGIVQDKRQQQHREHMKELNAERLVRFERRPQALLVWEQQQEEARRTDFEILERTREIEKEKAQRSLTRP